MKHIKLFEEYEVTNEGKITRGLLKGAMTISGLIKGFSKLFTSERKEVFKTIKMGNKMIDLAIFLNDQKSWLGNAERLSDEDIKEIAENYKVDKKYPTITDVVVAIYKKDIGRDMLKDLTEVVDVLNDKNTLKGLKNKTPKNIATINMMKELFTDLKEEIESGNE